MAKPKTPIYLLPDVPPSPPPSLLPRWAVAVIGSTLVLTIVGLVAMIVHLRYSGRHAEGGPEADAREPDRRPDTADRNGKPSGEADPGGSARKRPRPTEPVLTLVGGLMTAHLYQSYLNIGLIADGVAKDVYKVEEGKELLETVTRMMDTVERQLAQLPEAELQPEERRHLEKARRVLSLLRSQGKELKAYWDTGEEEYIKRFQKIRKDVQQELDRLTSEPD
jgi:hypothetical protein